MKRCGHCKNIFESSLLNCPSCGYGPDQVDGFYAYAPEFSCGGGGFKPEYFTELIKLEETNFWFIVRNRLIVWALKRYCLKFISFLEIGCGTGYVLSGVADVFPDTKLYGSEIFTAGLGYSAARLPSVDFMQMDARDIPYIDEFDVIGAFDVLEHIEEDEAVLGQVYSALKPDGYFIATVPQHMWLWSVVDESACHVRRYTATELDNKIKSAGFVITRSTSFVSVLLPIMLLIRLFKKNINIDEYDVTSELRINPLLNKALQMVINFELSLIKLGINLPIGGSRLIISTKK